MITAIRWKLLKLCKRLYQLLYMRVVIILVTLLCLGFSIALVGTYYLSINLVDSQAIHYAKVAVKTLNEARILYSKNVVDRIKSMDGIMAIAEYHTVKGGIPNPATYTIELGERLSDESEGMLFRLYSEHPFPNRQLTGGPLDKFEWDALTYLKEHPQASFYRKEQFGDRLSFRYTEAVLMEPSCVACHNTLRISPRKDWKVGQVRGVVEITQPVDNVILIAEDGLKVIYTVLITIIGLAISGLIVVIGRFRTINQELEQKVLERTAALNHLAAIDGLTQLINRRQFNILLQQEWRRMQQQQRPLSLILCDVDYFKKYNDTYGHVAGDNCLRAVAQVLDSSVKRCGEFAARYGGEEFAIVLPGVNSFEATKVATIIMDGIHSLKIPHKTSLNNSYVTLSMGIASTIPQNQSYPEQLIKCADRGLYQAKEEGRNRFIIWHDKQE